MWQSRYASFVRLFRGREDVIAERRNGEYVPVPGAGLTFERFCDHVQMRKTFAVYNRDDAGTVHFGLFDLDILPRNQGWEKLLLSMGSKKAEVFRVMETLTEMGLERRNLLLEFPTVGYHLFIFFEQPVPMQQLKTLMRFVLTRSGLERTPFYPRRTDAPWGDPIQLPLRINKNTAHRSNFIRNLETFDPEHYSSEPDFSVLEDVAPIHSEWFRTALEKHGLS